ncbi:MAG: hypothetical protein U9N14_06465 [Pseudomonadota bacterium]|nr:hypothetical protein [Pseudomonadota bacterium]
MNLLFPHVILWTDQFGGSALHRWYASMDGLFRGSVPNATYAYAYIRSIP